MSRYRVRLVPSGVIPHDVDIGVRLARPAAAGDAAAAACVRTWEGWGVTVNGTPYIGASLDLADNTPIIIPDTTTWDVTIDLIGELCPGECIDWEMFTLSLGSGDFSEVVVTEACESVTLTWEAEDELTPFGSILFAAYAFVNGEAFGFPQLLVTGDVDCVQVDEVGGWNGLQDGPTPPTHITAGPVTSFPAAAFTPFTIDFSPALSDEDAHIASCFDGLAATLFFTGGDPGAYADFAVEDTIALSTGSVVFRITCTGANDYTGTVITVVPRYLLSAVPVTPTFDLFAA